MRSLSASSCITITQPAHLSEPLPNYAINYLGSSGEDIEWLLSTLESFKIETTFADFVTQRILDIEINSNSNYHHLRQNFNSRNSQLKSNAGLEISRIKKIIFQKLAQYKPEQARELYLNLVKEIKDSFGDIALSFITTNYDLTFETAIESYSREWAAIGINDIDFGFSIQFGRPIYNPAQDFRWNSSVIEYLKIHGSVDWHLDSRGKCTRSMSNTVPDDPDQMAILYPGFKGIPELDPFISIHGRLSKRLAEADSVIIIGFAFRDAYINSIFENILRFRTDLKIFYFNPIKIGKFPRNSLVPYLINNYPNFKHIERGISIEENSLKLKDPYDPSA